jgi:hypothetical protein
MKKHGGVDVQIHIFLISTVVGGEWSALRSGRFTPESRAHGTHCIGSWVDPRASLDDVEKRKFLILPAFELLPLGWREAYKIKMILYGGHVILENILYLLK